MNNKPEKKQKKKIRCAENKDAFSKQREEYFSALKSHPIPKITDENPLNIIYSTKQAKLETQIAIYENISFFEAVNRIATDLVFWQGINKVLEKLSWDKIKEIKYCLGNENSLNHGDFTIRLRQNEEELEGEVFFAAPSYFPAKMRYTLKKWEKMKKELRYVLFNSDAVSEPDIEKLKKNNPKITFISVNLSD